LTEELKQRFLPRFVETSRGRLARARSLFDGGDAPTLAHELHALAGEAMMLDLRVIADNARRGESAARAWSRSSEASSEGADPRAICASCIDNVGEAILELSSAAPANSGGTQGTA
jgi:hypothetical protein